MTVMENEAYEWDSWIPETPGKPSPLNLQNQVLEDASCAAAVESNSSNAFLSTDEPINLFLPSDNVELDPPSSAKKRKNNQQEVNDQLPKGTKRKIYRPKVFSQVSRRTKKSQAKSTNTPKPSTPKQKKNYVRKSSSCRRQLFDEDSVSLPFLKKFNGLKVEQVGFENSIIPNESGLGYNSLQSYDKVTSLSSLCMVESKLIGANFPLTCKKKRIGRQRLRLEQFLAPFKRGKRSKSFVRKGKHWIGFDLGGNGTISRKMISIIKKIRSSKKKLSRKTKELVVYNETRQLVPYKKPSLVVDVMLDEETSRVWNLLKDEKGHQEDDEMKRMYWENIRRMFRDKVESFICHMHVIQGDRRFSPWKGSVLDSVIGAFLTQNVSDHLSSSAFMTLAAKFPIKTTSCEESNEELATPDKPESIGSNGVFPGAEFDKEMEDCIVEEVEAEKAKESSKVDDEGAENHSSLTAEKPDPLEMLSPRKKAALIKKNMNEEEKEKQRQYWDTLRKIHTKIPRDIDHMDSVDWEGVRCAQASEVARAIASRGQHNIIAGRIQRLLNSLMDSNGNMDLEWLRSAPPKEAKEYLLNIYGLGLKSVECIRLLTLHHIAFPVDVNVGRIVVRLGWVPLQPLPEQIQMHNLEMFPDSNKIQQYLWPRLCTLDQRTLYELHYQLITFGKVFCTKRNPNCKACPMRNECQHYASALASARPALPEPTPDQRIVVTPMQPADSSNNSTLISHFTSVSISEDNTFVTEASKECEPIIEMPASPEPESTEYDNFKVRNEDEELYKDDIDYDIEDIPVIRLCSQETHTYFPEEYEHDDMNKSTALVALHADAANIPIPKMKNVSRLKTERLVYVLPDGHPLLAEHVPRERDDPSPYLLVVWTTGELESSCESTKNNLQEEENSLTVPGTLLIPCRTAMRGCFPLNGTYFQVNEVFADHASMIHPINVPRKWLWNLEKRIVYFGTGASAIMRGLSVKQIHDIFWNGFVCVRAMDAKTRASRPISSILHRSTTAKVGKGNKDVRVLGPQGESLAGTPSSSVQPQSVSSSSGRGDGADQVSPPPPPQPVQPQIVTQGNEAAQVSPPPPQPVQPQIVTQGKEAGQVSPPPPPQPVQPQIVTQGKEAAQVSQPSTQPFIGPLPKDTIMFSRPPYRPPGLKPARARVPSGNPVRRHPIRPNEPVKDPSSLVDQVSPPPAPQPVQPPIVTQGNEAAQVSQPSTQPFIGPLPKGKIMFSRPPYRPPGLIPPCARVPRGDPIGPNEPGRVPSSLVASLSPMSGPSRSHQPTGSPLPSQPECVTLETIQSAIHDTNEGFMKFTPTSTIPPESE